VTSVLQAAAAKYVLGLLSGDDLPYVAADALTSGVDCSSLRVLASIGVGDREAEQLFEKSLRELGLNMPSRHDAAVSVAREVAQKILRGDVSCLDGANIIWDIYTRSGSDTVELHPFVYAASEWQDRPDDSELFERMIREGSRKIVSKTTAKAGEGDAHDSRDITQ
jgi:hypothetical protein